MLPKDDGMFEIAREATSPTPMLEERYSLTMSVGLKPAFNAWLTFGSSFANSEIISLSPKPAFCAWRIR